MVLSACSESAQQNEPPATLDFFVIAVCSNSSSDSLGFCSCLGIEVRYLYVLPQNEVLGSVLPNGVFEIVLLQNKVFGVVLSQIVTVKWGD